MAASKSTETGCPADLDVPIILDNDSTHQSALVKTWRKPKKQRRFHFHFTPPPSPELEQAIYQWLATWNDKRATADVILDQVRRCREATAKS